LDNNGSIIKIGFEISIPTIIIRKTEGEKLIKAVKDASSAKKDSDKAVIATMNFAYVQNLF